MNIITNSLETNLILVLALVLAFVLVMLLLKAYTDFPDWQDKKRLTITLFIAIFFVALVFFTKGVWDYVVATGLITIYQLIIIPFILFNYITASLLFISFAAYKKGGFSEVRGFREDGLIGGFISYGVMSWFFMGLIGGLASQLGSRPIYETLSWSVAAALAGLILTLVLSWEKELED